METANSVSEELQKEANELLKLSDEEFTKKVLRTSDKHLAELSAVESLVTRTRSIMDERPKDLERWRKEVAEETSKPSK